MPTSETMPNSVNKRYKYSSSDMRRTLAIRSEKSAYVEINIFVDVQSFIMFTMNMDEHRLIEATDFHGCG